jgi:adenylate cyclase
MESLASPDTCYATAQTVALAGGYFSFENLGKFRVKGVADEVEAHRLIGLGAARTRFDISRAKGLSRFVGRTADLRTLEDATEQTDAGDAQVVGVVAMAGTGKSRLCFEFLERCRARGMQVFESRAVAHGKNIPFLPILELMRAFFGITLEDDDRSAREKIAGRMVLLDLGFADALPLLFDFLGVAESQQTPLRIEPDARQRQLLTVIRKVIQNVSEDRPTITLIEDLHWMDDASGEFLEQMVEAREGTRNLLLLNFRPEYHADWMQKSWYRQIPLTPLGPEAIGELLADLLGDDPSIAELAGPIHERTAGNPFFTEEVAQTLIESGHLEGERGAYRLATPFDRLEVPATVQSVLAARIDRLPEREKQLLQVASVIGKDFPEPLLAEVAEIDRDDLKTALAELRRAEFIHEQAIYPVAEYSFKHPLTQEVALGSQLADRRRTVHAAIARAIERQDVEHLDERAPLLAHHFEEGGDAVAALRWHQRAANWVGVTDFDAAAYHWGRVRELVRELPGTRETAVVGIAACTYLLNATRRLAAGVDAAQELLDEGQALANSIDDPLAHLKVSMAFSRTHATAGDTEAFLEVANANQRAALEVDDVAARSNAHFFLLDAMAFSCQLPESLEMADDGLARFPSDLSPEDWIAGCNPYWVFSIWRAVCLAWMGRLGEVDEEIARAERQAEQDATAEEVTFNLIRIAEIAYLKGDAAKALASARKLEEVVRMLGEPRNAAALSQLAFAYAHLSAGRAADAIEPAREAFAKAERVFACDAAARLAEALLRSGDLDAAEKAAEEAIEVCRRSLRANAEAAAHGSLALARIRRDGASARVAAEASLAEVAAIIDRTSARGLEPLLCEWRAELAAALGDTARRTELLDQARKGFRETGAPMRAERLDRDLDT